MRRHGNGLEGTGNKDSQEESLDMTNPWQRLEVEKAWKKLDAVAAGEGLKERQDWKGLMNWTDNEVKMDNGTGVVQDLLRVQQPRQRNWL